MPYPCSSRTAPAPSTRPSRPNIRTPGAPAPQVLPAPSTSCPSPDRPLREHRLWPMLQGLLPVPATGGSELLRILLKGYSCSNRTQVLPAPRTPYYSPFDFPGISVWLVLQLSSGVDTAWCPPARPPEAGMHAASAASHNKNLSTRVVSVATAMPVRSSSCCQPLESGAKVNAAFTPLPYRCAASWAAQLAHLLGAPACSRAQAAVRAFKEAPCH